MNNDKRGLEDCRLTLERVPYCKCALVTGLAKVTTTDALKFYFENPRNGCGEEPSKIELDEDLGRALVHFSSYAGKINESFKVKNNFSHCALVLSKNEDGLEFRVSRYSKGRD